MDKRNQAEKENCSTSSCAAALNIGKSGCAIRPEMTFTSNWGNVLQSDSVTLRCDEPSTEPDEPRIYSWYKDTRPIHGDQQTRQITASLRDNGDYQCRISAGDISDPVTLNVTNTYVILQRPPSTIYEGDPLTLKCHHIKDFNGFDTKFYKNGEEIKSQILDSQLRIPKVDLNTAGHYKCTKQLSFLDHPGSFEFLDEFSISVKELFSPPNIKVTLYRVIEGGDMTVRCEFRLDPLRSGTELEFAFYRDGRTEQEFGVSDTYRVQSAHLEDSGNYTCRVRTASDTVKKTSNKVYIQVYIPEENPAPQDVCYTYLELSHMPKPLNVGKSGAIRPVVTFTPNYGNILYYDNVTLTCDEPSSSPEEPRTYSWYRNNTEIGNRNQQTLHIIGSQVDLDRGDYQCRISAGDISDPVFLNVTQNFVILQRPPSAIYEGDPLTLRCHHVKDYIAINTKFYRNDKEIQSSNTDSEFHIHKTDMSLSGLYKCTKQIRRYDQKDVQEHSDEFRISVKELFTPPKIKVTLDMVIDRRDMTLTCDTGLDPLRSGTELQFAFYKDGRPVREFNGSNTYRLEDSGSYTCEVKTASDGVRKMSDGFYVKIIQRAIRPVVTFTPNWGNILYNDDVTLTCDEPSTSPEEPRTYSWYKDNTEIGNQNQQTLHIIGSQVPRDKGDYQCRISAGDISDPVFLNVTQYFVILQRPPSAIYEGDPLTLRCHHYVKDFNAIITKFYRNDKEIQPSNTDSEFHIHRIDMSLSGLYKCTKQIQRYDLLQVQEHSDELRISVKELFSAPKIKVTPERVREGGDMTVTCDIRLDPLRSGTELQFAFYRDGRPVREFNGSDTYRVQSDQLEDSGNYTCEVRTANDTVKKMSDGLHVQIHEAKFPVEIVAAAVIGSLAVIVASAVLIWKCKKRKRFEGQESRQETTTEANNTDPDQQDVCYTYLDISRLPKATKIKPG
ncbi:Fc receptor-like protein 3 [Mantella aurantiaca]